MVSIYVSLLFTGYSKPFNIRVHTDSLEGTSIPSESANRGFCFNYVQQPCNSATGKWVHLTISTNLTQSTLIAKSSNWGFCFNPATLKLENDFTSFRFILITDYTLIITYLHLCTLFRLFKTLSNRSAYRWRWKQFISRWDKQSRILLQLCPTTMQLIYWIDEHINY